MKVLIDIPDDAYRHITEDDVFVYTARTNGKTFVAEMLKAIKKGLPVSDNATNGDVIKAVFPKANVWESAGRICVDGHGCLKTFSIVWWNAPYKAESEEV